MNALFLLQKLRKLLCQMIFHLCEHRRLFKEFLFQVVDHVYRHRFEVVVAQLLHGVLHGLGNARMVAGGEIFRGDAHFQALDVTAQRGLKVLHTGHCDGRG